MVVGLLLNACWIVAGETLSLIAVQAWAPPGTPIEVYTHNRLAADASGVPGATAVRLVEPNVGAHQPSLPNCCHHPIS